MHQALFSNTFRWFLPSAFGNYLTHERVIDILLNTWYGREGAGESWQIFGVLSLDSSLLFSTLAALVSPDSQLHLLNSGSALGSTGYPLLVPQRGNLLEVVISEGNHWGSPCLFPSLRESLFLIAQCLESWKPLLHVFCLMFVLFREGEKSGSCCLIVGDLFFLPGSFLWYSFIFSVQKTIDRFKVFFLSFTLAKWFNLKTFISLYCWKCFFFFFLISSLLISLLYLSRTPTCQISDFLDQFSVSSNFFLSSWLFYSTF